eukprot:403366117
MFFVDFTGCCVYIIFRFYPALAFPFAALGYILNSNPALEFSTYFTTFLVMMTINILQFRYFRRNLHDRKQIRNSKHKRRMVTTTFIFSISLLYRASLNFAKFFMTPKQMEFENLGWYLIIHTYLVVLPIQVTLCLQYNTYKSMKNQRSKISGSIYSEDVGQEDGDQKLHDQIMKQESLLKNNDQQFRKTNILDQSTVSDPLRQSWLTTGQQNTKQSIMTQGSNKIGMLGSPTNNYQLGDEQQLFSGLDKKSIQFRKDFRQNQLASRSLSPTHLQHTKNNRIVLRTTNLTIIKIQFLKGSLLLQLKRTFTQNKPASLIPEQLCSQLKFKYQRGKFNFLKQYENDLASAQQQ